MTQTSPNCGVFWSGSSNDNYQVDTERGAFLRNTEEEFLPEQGNGSVSLPPIVSNWQQVSLQIQHKITLQKQLKRCFRSLAREEADNWRNFHCFYGQRIWSRKLGLFSVGQKVCQVTWVSDEGEKYFEYWGKPKLLRCAKGLDYSKP